MSSSAAPPPGPSARRPHRPGRLLGPLAGVLTVAVLAAGCSGGTTAADDPAATGTDATAARGDTAADPAAAAPAEQGPQRPELGVPTETAVLAGDDPAGVALSTSQAVFASAPVVVLAPVGDAAQQLRAAGVAVTLGAPLLLTDPATPPAPAASSSAGPSADPAVGSTAGTAEPAPQPPAASEQATAAVHAAVRAEVDRLGAEAVLAVGDVASAGLEDLLVAAPADLPVDGLLGRTVPVPADLRAVLALEPAPAGEPVPAEPADGADTGGATLPPTVPVDEAPDGLVVLTTGAAAQVAAVATARAARLPVVEAPRGDPRSTTAAVEAVAALDPTTALGLGPAFGDAETLRWRTATAATGVLLPGGNQLVLPGKTYVALYGSPITASLGVLGEQGPDATIERARQQAAPYEDLTDTEVVPTLEIIATVASGSAGGDGDYSNEWPVEDLRPLVDRAREAGQYVLLDLQPGRSGFRSQAQEYEELLREPHVGLALDPEWRLEPDERHLRQIGSVSVDEVDATLTWLADLVREERLPQKMVVLHSFRRDMIPDVDTVDRSRSEVAVLMHVDGQGSQPAKQDTWRSLQEYAPGIEWWGWKNFVDEDSPMLTPEQTMQVEPTPDLITYQ